MHSIGHPRGCQHYRKEPGARISSGLALIGKSGQLTTPIVREGREKPPRQSKIGRLQNSIPSIAPSDSTEIVKQDDFRAVSSQGRPEWCNESALGFFSSGYVNGDGDVEE